MKLLIILSVVACSYAAKLDRTYLPPPNAVTAGGSPGSLTAPGNGPTGSASGPLAFSGTVSGNIGSGQSSFGKYAAPTLGQQPASGFGQPDTSITNQPTGQGLNQPSAPGFQTLTSQYTQPAGETGFGKPNAVPSTFANTPTGFGQATNSFDEVSQEQTNFQSYQPERARASIDRNAEILRYDNQNDGETFAYSFETSNGISAEESGVATDGVRAQGAFAYSDDDGQVIRLTYTADENGYQPQGDHLPTPHPIPEEILRSIEQNARAAAAGTQEGAYNPDEDVYTPQRFNGVAPTYQGQDRAQNTYSQSQGQGPNSQYSSPSIIGSGSVGPVTSEVSKKTPLTGSLGFQGSNKGGQSAPGYTQSGENLSQSGYQYSQPQANAQYARPSASSTQYDGQYRPESAPGFAKSGEILSQSVSQNNQPQTNTQFSRPSVSSSQSFGQYRPESAPGFAKSGENLSQSGYQYSQPQANAQLSRPSVSSSQTVGNYRPDSESGFAKSGESLSQYGYQNNQPQLNTQFSRPSVSSSQTSGQYRPNSASGFAKSGESLSQSGYQYNQPQANAQFGRPSAPSSQTPGQYRPDSAPSAQSEESFVGSSPRVTDKAFASSGSNPQRPFTDFASSGKLKGSITEPISTVTGFGTGSGFGQNPSAPATKVAGQYQPSQSTSGSSMPAQSAPYEYNRPGPKATVFQQTGAQPGFNASGDQTSSTQIFGAPRQPPSFTEEEGYKY